MNKKLKTFLENHGLSANSINAEAVLSDFLSEMEKGLAGEESSLQMIPTYITTDTDIPLEKKVIVIDAGGTNLRIALIHFDKNSEVVIDEIEKYKMPGAKTELTAEEFFKTFADYLKPVVSKSKKIGFCFSYPAEISPNRDGKLTHWTKEIKVPEVEGTFIGKGLIDALGNNGNDKSLSLLNDTIATLLAGKAQSTGNNCSSYIGLILGTGTNIAYIEHNKNITKTNHADINGSQAINVESGGFSLSPQGDLDKALDAKTINPDSYLFEKMIAGCYRGDLILLALQTAANDNLFSEEYISYILSLKKLAAMHADFFLKSSQDSPLSCEKMTGSDIETVNSIINEIYLRTAKLTAINIVAAVIKSGAGTDPEHPICINIDGTTYYKSVGFKEMVETYLLEMLGKRNIAYMLLHVDDAPIIGAAIGGLSS